MGRIDDVVRYRLGLLLKIQAEKQSWLFPCMLLDFVLCTIYMMYIYPYPFFFSGK